MMSVKTVLASEAYPTHQYTNIKKKMLSCNSSIYLPFTYCVISLRMKHVANCKQKSCVYNKVSCVDL